MITDQSPITNGEEIQQPLGSEKNRDACSSAEVEAVRSLMAVFATAVKNYSLYPEAHSISKKFLSSLENSLMNFFQTFPFLKLDIEKDKICFKGNVVYNQHEKEDYLTSPLFRDGILWIEFTKDITEDELSFLLSMLNEYRILKDESEGDLVTALWKQNLPHVHYESAEVYWEKEPKLDFSHFSVTGHSNEQIQVPAGPKNGSVGPEQQSTSEDIGNQATVSIFSSKTKIDLMQLTPDETATLQNLIIEDENRNHAEDVMDVLLIILEELEEENEFGSILEILIQEFENILAHGEFRLAVKMLGFLKKLPHKNTSHKSWQIPLLNQFLETVSDSKVLKSIKEYFPKFISDDASQLKAFREVFLMLHPKAVLTLGTLLSEVTSADALHYLIEAITILSKQDLNPLSQLLKMSEDNLVELLVTILGNIDGNEPQKLMLNMARHPSPSVRMEALKQLLKRSGQVQRSFLFLLEDPSKLIRQEILNSLGSERDKISEYILLEYLDQKATNIADRDHILACYRALGKCGSSRSITFLKAAMTEQPWSDIFHFRELPHRFGAAVALTELEIPEADIILKQATHSFFPHIKRSARRAILERLPA
ncbi:MAG: hypothetical protein KJ826_19645 [Proteobacteria bacterium]|nr:hypothetical protein [Pseudomonadota bacterium]MBU4036579.1 hypothetical protein [Pseudomonadota bacterium]